MVSLLRSLNVCVLGLCVSIVFIGQANAQVPQPGVGVTVDSLVRLEQSADSLIRLDSLKRIAAKKPTQLATMREIDLTNDGKPEILRLSGKVVPNTDNIKLEFTIRSGKKVMYKDNWTAKGYFDESDELAESLKFMRLRRIVTVFFANENFSVLDSAKFKLLLENGTPAELVLNSPQSEELFSADRVMYSVFASRDNFYGLVWLPSKKKFIKAWSN